MAEKRTRVLHISTSDSNGGASKAAFKIHMSMLDINVLSKMLVLHKGSNEETVVKYEVKKTLKQRMLWIAYLLNDFFLTKIFRFNQIARSGEIFSMSFNPYLIDKNLLNVDAVIIHWNVGFINLRHLFKLIPKETKIYWRLADMHPFTGGCHYAFTCTQFAKGCGRCPELSSSNLLDASRIGYWQKKRSYQKLIAEHKNITLIVLSHWMKKQLSLSGLMNTFPITHIPNGVELDKFYPLTFEENLHWRKIHHIPSSKINILVIADDLANKRKGLEFLQLVAEQYPEELKNFWFYFVSDRPDIEINFSGINCKVLPKTSVKAELRRYYGMVDATLYISLEENFANVILESFACGTPVIGFDSGGAKDLLRHRSNAIITTKYDEIGLKEVFTDVLKYDKEALKELGAKGLSLIKEHYSMELCIAAYFDEIKSIA